MRYSFQLGGATHIIDLHKTARGYRAGWNDQELLVYAFENRGGELSLDLNGRQIRAYFASDGARRWVWVDGQTLQLTVTSGAQQARRPSAHSQAGERIITAPMPGVVRAVGVSQGDQLTKGQVLCVLEAMKMEIHVQAHRDGKLVQLNVRAGQTVERDQVLAELE